MEKKIKEIKTAKELREILKKMPCKNKQQRNEIVCSLIGHSRIQSTFMGYWNCGRCNQQLGDSLGSMYPQAKETVIIGHKCEICIANYKKFNWKDKIYVENPFKETIV